MLCLNCGIGLKFLRSQSTRKMEVWGCPRKGCSFREEFPLWGDTRIVPDGDCERVHRVYHDHNVLAVWHWSDDEGRAA